MPESRPTVCLGLSGRTVLQSGGTGEILSADLRQYPTLCLDSHPTLCYTMGAARDTNESRQGRKKVATVREQAIKVAGDTFQERMDKIDSLFEGNKVVAQALGEDYYLNETTGEMMAQNDYDRNETASAYMSWIQDALRFARANSAKFQGFVEGLRQLHADSDREEALQMLEATFSTK